MYGFLHICTQVEVAQQDGGLGGGDEENDEYQEQILNNQSNSVSLIRGLVDLGSNKL
jgi:hypothetical protein